MEWKDDKSNLHTVVAEALQNAEVVRATCCTKPAIHVYGHKHRGNRGSAWGWCSNCGAFVHLDGIELADNWQNSKAIDFEKLTAVPKYLEEHKDAVDRHLASFIG